VRLAAVGSVVLVLSCSARTVQHGELAPVGAAVRVSFAAPRTIAAPQSNQDTLRVHDVRALIGTVRGGSPDTVVMTVASVVTPRGETSVPAGTTVTVLRDAGVAIQVLSTKPGAVELTVLGVIVVGLLGVVLVFWSLSQGG
jgi:hypothetical protein